VVKTGHWASLPLTALDAKAFEIGAKMIVFDAIDKRSVCSIPPLSVASFIASTSGSRDMS
jgi:hypothetical protein